MPFFVRAGLRYNRWLETEGHAPEDFPADTITDLRTIGNELSVYEISGLISAERIATALAAAPAKKKPDDTAYAIFDRAEVEALAIPIRKTPGGTIDPTVNGLHYDLAVGTAGKLLQFAGIVARGEVVSIPKKRVGELLKAGFESGQLNHTKNPPLRDAVKAQIPTSSEEEIRGL